MEYIIYVLSYIKFIVNYAKKGRFLEHTLNKYNSILKVRRTIEGEVVMTTLETLLSLLPEGWEEACFTCGAIRRKRKIRSPKDWMTLCLIYFMENCSMVQLSAMVSMLEIADLSDVVLLDRLGASKKWFE